VVPTPTDPIPLTMKTELPEPTVAPLPTCNCPNGFVVPMPTEPPALTTTAEVPELICNLPSGFVVPMPT